jgi:hypothetical protein
VPDEDSAQMISGGELTAAARVASAVRRALKRPDPASVLRRRQEVREALAANLRLSSDSTPEVVVIRLGREKNYPEPDNRIAGFGASPWFKLEVKGLHDRGLEAFDSIQHVHIRNSIARKVGEPGARKVYIVGRIPYERIAHMDWSPDPAYGVPRLYVSYGRKGPYKEVVLYDTTPGPNGYLFPLHNVDYRPEKVRSWTRIAWNVRQRRHERQHMIHPYDDVD